MAINYSTLIYTPVFEMFSRTVTFFPYVSQPGGEPYPGRGIFDTRLLNIQSEDGTVFTDQETILDILEVEFDTLPQQGDHIFVDTDLASGVPAQGEFEILSGSTNGGGETTLILRKWLAPRP
jgi:hypothetical protein